MSSKFFYGVHLTAQVHLVANSSSRVSVWGVMLSYLQGNVCHLSPSPAISKYVPRG